MDIRLTLLIKEKVERHKFQSLLELLASDESISIAHIFIDKRPRPNRIERIKKNLARGRGGYILIMFLSSLKKDKYMLLTRNILSKYSDKFIEVQNLKDDAVIKTIKDSRTNLAILMSGFGILKADFINLFELGILSYHHGDMSKYRGMPPLFWEIYNNERNVGCTVQKLNSYLDKGEILSYREAEIGNEPYRVEKQKLYSMGVPMLKEAYMNLLESRTAIDSPKYSKEIYTLPNMTQWFRFLVINFLRVHVKSK